MGIGPRGLAAALAAVLALGVLAVAVLGAAVTDGAPSLTSAGGCRLITDTTAADDAGAQAPTAGAGLRLDADQLTNAAIITGVARAMGLPERAAVVGLATALQESKLRVLSQAQSDRDSAGIFQQRPSMGWGSLSEVMDPVHATRTFYRHLVQVPGWAELPVTVAAQAVQRSAYPDAYAQWETEAHRLAAALAGDGTATIRCVAATRPLTKTSGAGQGGWPPEQMGPDGLTPRTRYLRDLIRSGFGETNLGGWCPGGCSSGHVEGSDHYDGHAIDIMILPHTDPTRVADGNRLVGWLVTHAHQLAIKYVIWRATIWTPEQGWHPYTHPSGSASPTLAHMDHVHVSVH